METHRPPIARAVGKRVYAYLKTGRLSGLTRLAVVQRVHGRLAPFMSLADVLEIAAVLDGAGVHYWLAGGWGIDALVGSQTRDHRDLDLVIDSEDTALALEAVTARGFRHMPAVQDNAHREVPGAFMPLRELVRDDRQRTIDIHPVDLATWPEKRSLTDRFATGNLGGRDINCLSVAAQRAAHEGYQLSQAHIADLEALDGHVGATL
jgi:lincosamide nucleotidyltransferase A/C/D/E